MKSNLIGRSFVFCIVSIATSALASAATVSDPNIFNNGTTQAAAFASSTYPGFSASSIDDLNGDNQFFFADVGVGATETLSLSGFSAPSGISTLRFYGEEEFEIRRVPLSVTIYTSANDLTGATSLDESNYSLLGTFALPATPNLATNHAYYTTGVDSTGGDGNYSHYDDLTNLGIAAGTQSILFDFSPETNGGRGLAEIQGFAAAPEPSTWALMLAGLGGVAYAFRRRLVIG